MSSSPEFEVEVKVKEFAGALGNARSVIDRRNVIEDLTKVKLSISDKGMLQIISTNIELYFKQEIGCTAKAHSTDILLPSDVTFNIVRFIEDETIILRKMPGKDAVELIGKTARFSLDAKLASEYVAFEDISGMHVSIKIPAKTFTQIMDYTLHAVSREESRYVLNGIYLHIKNHRLCAGATDSHRLVHVSLEPVNIDTKDFANIVPTRAAEEIAKLLKDKKFAEQDLEIVMSSNKIKFVCDNVVFISKVIDGSYPDYSGFIPSSEGGRLEIDGEQLYSAIERMRSVTTDKFPAVKMIFSKKQLKITASGYEIGKSEEVLAGTSPSAEKYHFDSSLELEVGFNPSYLLDALSASGKKRVALFIKDKNSPALIKILPTAESSLDLDANFVVMPFSV